MVYLQIITNNLYQISHAHYTSKATFHILASKPDENNNNAITTKAYQIHKPYSWITRTSTHKRRLPETEILRKSQQLPVDASLAQIMQDEPNLMRETRNVESNNTLRRINWKTAQNQLQTSGLAHNHSHRNWTQNWNVYHSKIITQSA